MRTINDPNGIDTQIFFLYVVESGSQVLFLTTVVEPQFSYS